ncbi:hypothetical protein C8A00DRAFT_30645 [Chaetomidium leptoderma]|uniref:U4/U6.U5 small nuclear ribonucleoprotein 27kDa protein domain-containing protein n=1 Tax=Chaetomidium leptoderma TaxID=669021 RepID=A0AAN6VSJ7_9PEZI|nr:hypothetical protein C8A00DRAFT_30645 [Chaetomidium leptoderma]
MADRRDGQPRRGGDRSFHDNRDRRRDRDGGRDRDDNNRRNNGGARDLGRDRDKDRDHRRYRSRSRDRGDRRRSRSPGRERGYDRRDGDRDRERDRGQGRRGGDRAEPQRERGDRSVRGERERAERGTSHTVPTTRTTSNGYGVPDKPNRDLDRSRDARTTTQSPRRSASPKRVLDKDTDEYPQLPTRPKSSSTHAPAPPAAPVSFKVKTQNRDGSHGPEPRQQPTSTHEDSHEQHQQRHYEDGGDRHQPKGRFDAEPMDEDEEDDIEVEDEGLDDMAAMMGFGGFGTTKNKKVLGNNVGVSRKEKKTEYRQYMNRVGGFNRPLSPGR